MVGLFWGIAGKSSTRCEARPGPAGVVAGAISSRRGSRNLPRARPAAGRATATARTPIRRSGGKQAGFGRRIDSPRGYREEKRREAERGLANQGQRGMRRGRTRDGNEESAEIEPLPIACLAVERAEAPSERHQRRNEHCSDSPAGAPHHEALPFMSDARDMPDSVFAVEGSYDPQSAGKPRANEPFGLAGSWDAIGTAVALPPHVLPDRHCYRHPLPCSPSMPSPVQAVAAACASSPPSRIRALRARHPRPPRPHARPRPARPHGNRDAGHDLVVRAPDHDDPVRVAERQGEQSPVAPGGAGATSCSSRR